VAGNPSSRRFAPVSIRAIFHSAVRQTIDRSGPSSLVAAATSTSCSHFPIYRRPAYRLAWHAAGEKRHRERKSARRPAALLSDRYVLPWWPIFFYVAPKCHERQHSTVPQGAVGIDMRACLFGTLLFFVALPSDVFRGVI